MLLGAPAVSTWSGALNLFRLFCKVEPVFLLLLELRLGSRNDPSRQSPQLRTSVQAACFALLNRLVRWERARKQYQGLATS